MRLSVLHPCDGADAMMLVPLFVFFLLAVTGVLSWGAAFVWWLVKLGN